MASGMSNFNIKKSFVWKYGLSKLHKKKDAEESDSGEPRTPDEDMCDPLEPDLDLRPQWEPPLAGEDPEVPQKRRSGPLVTAVHAPAATRTMDTAVSQYIRVVAQMQGYDVAGCRSVLRDGVVPFPKPETEPPIYETLSEFHRGADGGATIAEDQQTLYENDDTDDELSGPLYENSAPEQPIYANGMQLEDSDEADEAPIYENLGVGETPPSPVPSLPPKPTGVSEPTYGHLEVEVRSDHGYDSYQSPTSGSSDASGDSPAKLSPNSESSGSECGAGQRALASAETVAPTRAGIPPPPPLPPPPPVTTTMARAKKALGQAVSLPPAGRQGGADRPKLDLPAARGEDRPASEIENKLAPSFVAQLHDMLQKKSNGIKPEPEPSKISSSPAQVEKSVDKKRGKAGDTMAFQMARKAVAQALQKGRPQEPQESPKVKLTQSLSVPSDKPDVTAPVERVAVVPGMIPPPPPLPAPSASGAAKPSTSLIKTSAQKSLQHDLKKKLEAKKASMQAEKIESKKKKLGPKPPDRSFSLPGFGNARLDIAKAFEEFKRNEAIKKEEALMKKKKSKYVDKLDLKDYKKPSSNTGEVEEEMFALAAESADAVNSDLEQRAPMKSFLSDDPPALQAEKTAAADSRSTPSLATQRAEFIAANLPNESSVSIPEEAADEPPPALPARFGTTTDLPPPPPGAERSAELHGESSFECVTEERAEPLPPRPRPLTKKPQLLQRPVQCAAVTHPVAAVAPPAAVTPPSAPTDTPPSTHRATPPASRPLPVDSEVTVSGSQVIQICPDGSWGVTERETGVASNPAVPAEQCQVEVNTNEHGTSVISTVELVSDEPQEISNIHSGSSESNKGHFSRDESNTIRLKLSEVKITDTDEVALKQPEMHEPVTDGLSDDEPITNYRGMDQSDNFGMSQSITEEPEEPSKSESNTDENNMSEPSANEPITGEPISDEHSTGRLCISDEHNTDRLDSVEPVTVDSSTVNPSTVDASTAELSTVELSTVDATPVETIRTNPSTANPSEVDLHTAQPSVTEPSTADLNTAEPSMTEPSLTGPKTVALCTSEFSTSAAGSSGAGPSVASHPRQMPGHAWARPHGGVAADCRAGPHAQTETDRADCQSGPHGQTETDRADGGDEPAEKEREEGHEGEQTKEGGLCEEEEGREEDQKKVEEGGEGAAAAHSEVREGESDEAGVTFSEDSVAQDDLHTSVNVSANVEIELKSPELGCLNDTEIVVADAECLQKDDSAFNITDKHVLAVKAEEVENSTVQHSVEDRSAEVDAPVESKVVTAAIQSIKLHVSAPEAVCATDASEEVPDTHEEIPSEPAQSIETPVSGLPSQTGAEVTVTPPEEEETRSTQEETAMPLFRASIVEVESAPSSLEESVDDRADPDSVTVHAPAPVPAPEIALVDDIEAQVAALRSKVLSVNSLSCDRVVPAPVPAPVPAEVSSRVSPCQMSPQTRPVWVSEVERQFEDLERTGAEEAEMPDFTPYEVPDVAPPEEMQQPITDDGQPTTDDGAVTEEDDDSADSNDDSPHSVESLSIIANKAQTKHFLESRLQESLGEQATPATPVIPDSPAPASTTPTDPPSAKMATQEPISPPPGFDDAADATVAGGGEVEGVEFEEFDMDWAPRRPVVPPVRSYMFGEQIGHNKPTPAPARPPASPSYRDLFTPDEAASSTASVASVVSVASLDVARQDSACGTSEPDETDDGGAETMIAQEIRELRRREEELRRLREKTLTAPAPETHGEEPLSGYGSEERESFTEEPHCPSRLLPCDRAVSHQRSRSADSLSSGHSSSGLGSDTGDLLARRRVTVKPFEETDDDERWSYPRSAETPIEREIRLSKERDDERRREQAMFSARHTMAAVFEEKQPATRGARPAAAPAPAAPAGLAKDPRQAALRLATGRVQEEIQEATRREIELRDEGKDITTSEETVDEKVTRLVDMTKHSVELTNDKKQRADLARDTARSAPAAVAKPSPGPKPAVKQVHIVPMPASEPARPTAAPAPAPAQTVSPAAGLKTDAPRPVFRPVVTGAAGRGLMHKFIASRGRLRPVSVFSPAPSGAGARELSPPRSSRPIPQLSVASTARTEQTAERRGPVKVPSRRVLTAEAKIQLELQTMKEREEELRRHRSRMMAKSQPDLLAALGDMSLSQEEADDDPAPGLLSRAMSNPNLLDDGPTETLVASANRRRRSTLIDQWESRIQGAEV